MDVPGAWECVAGWYPDWVFTLQMPRRRKTKRMVQRAGTVAINRSPPNGGLGPETAEILMARLIGCSFCSLDESEELLRAGDGIGDGVLAVQDDGRGGIGDPDHRRNQVGGGLQSEPNGIGRP